ncbi:MAG: hypothetical protein R3B82_27895 [Sandaracinaceae bacterium]
MWDERLRDAVAHAPKVEQPLLEWVDAEALAAWAEEPESLPSAIRHHYPFRDAVHTRPRTARR